MKQNPVMYVVMLYLSATVVALVFLPGLINDDGRVSHLIQHLLIIAYSHVRLRRTALAAVGGATQGVIVK
ncbi:hypothetical protein GCM10025858_11050 [Alicyclobacillus sacchari]|uniref:hypothetical protein n=1 Tax=Alicyclobacillus sacchari TaxID=392010 RepID=UPI0023E94024|nr:hypothetical protein [Alicyclobacillus sacchari]GMA56602.1 hypothetical protein GCM10025858_11050 [Alicyclobacillus sacchari]